MVKFLRKSSILKDCWVLDKEMGKVPLEIAFLARLSHDNIIQASHTCMLSPYHIALCVIVVFTIVLLLLLFSSSVFSFWRHMRMSIFSRW